MIAFLIIMLITWLTQICTYFASLHDSLNNRHNPAKWVKDRKKAIAMMIPFGFIYVLYKVIIESTE